MSKETEMKAVVSGSFNKFKDIIDLAIEELEDLGVTVLVPDKGWLSIPKYRIITPSELSFRPLPSEKEIPLKDIEDGFLRSISNSDFLYVVNPDGYIGNTVSMEIGFAIARNIPVYLQSVISEALDLGPQWNEITPKIKVATIQEALQDTEDRKSKQ